VPLRKDVVQWVVGGMFYQVMRGMVNAADCSGEARRQAKSPTDEVLRALPDAFDLHAVEAAATPVLSGLYQRAGRLPSDADTFAAEMVAGAIDDLRHYTAGQRNSLTSGVNRARLDVASSASLPPRPRGTGGAAARRQ